MWMSDETIRMKGKYKISCRVRTVGRNEVEVTGKHLKHTHHARENPIRNT